MTSEPMVHVVDDDPAMRDSLEFLFETAGLRARTYESGPALLAEAAALAPGCIVTDVRMPEMSGLELVRRLGEAGVTLPVIVMTGHADVPLAVEAMKAGVVDFIEKPFDDEIFLNAVRKALDVSGCAVMGDEVACSWDYLLPSLLGPSNDVCSPRESLVENCWNAIDKAHWVLYYSFIILIRTFQFHQVLCKLWYALNMERAFMAGFPNKITKRVEYVDDPRCGRRSGSIRQHGIPCDQRIPEH